VSIRTLGLVATIVGSALGAWWWTSQRARSTRLRSLPRRDRGSVIFDNTPTAADADAII